MPAERKELGIDSYEENHPAYGIFQISRINCPPRNLFGSSLQSENTIRFRVMRGTLHRDLNRDRYHEAYGIKNRRIVEFEMSYSQFAQAITSLNTSGTPCTLLNVMGEEQEECPMVNKLTELEQEFDKRIHHILQESKADSVELEKLLEKPSLSKADRKRIFVLSTNMNQRMYNYVPFIQKSFNEQLNKSVREAKGEIQAFQDMTLRQMGLKSMAEAKNLLEAGEDTKLYPAGYEGENYGNE